MDIPKIIRNGQYDYYKVEAFLGNGTFSKCYVLKNIRSGKLVATKSICKSTINTNKLKEKVENEIRIHQSLNHENIVQFITFFEDPQFVYMILEVCENRSLADFIKKRLFVVLSEAQYFMVQTVHAVQYLHHNRIVHRDLKLGNLFVNSQMRLKVGDFGLSAYVKGNAKSYAVCGTPNYIAPEVIIKAGHSFEVDIWALGCVLYHLLVGKPPFHTNSAETTYDKILKCDYRMPSNIPPSASIFIREILQLDPSKRPDINELLGFDFLTLRHIPDTVGCIPFNYIHSSRKSAFQTTALAYTSIKGSKNGKIIKLQAHCIQNSLGHLKRLMEHLKQVKNCPITNEDPAEGPKGKCSQPHIWVNAWVDYSVTYGFAYRLNDGSVGVMFNDHSCMVQPSNSERAQYLSNKGMYYSIDRTKPPAEFMKKLQILVRLQQYMQTRLRSAYDSQPNSTEDSHTAQDDLMPILVYWLRFVDSVAMMLSNGIFQVNFIDHSKLILCPETKTVTCFNNEERCKNKVNTLKFETLKIRGCSRILNGKLNIASQKISRLYDLILQNLFQKSKT